MSLVRWNPTRELTTWPSGLFGLQREMNKMFDTFFRGTEEDDAAFAAWSPAVDITEHEDAYVVKAELPGVNKDDVKITLESNILTIHGEKKQEKETKKENYHRVERSYGSFQRSFTLPTTVKSDKIEAQYKDGVLTVALPKAEEAKPKQIEVKVK
ncbi:MAG TPA: Hsp20/alpha crystallin family protein [Bacteroidota bacterium]|nr:Hsp20/alpha crystallin family protein [Bacteroidota bacterium]